MLTNASLLIEPLCWLGKPLVISFFHNFFSSCHPVVLAVSFGHCIRPLQCSQQTIVLIHLEKHMVYCSTCHYLVSRLSVYHDTGERQLVLSELKIRSLARLFGNDSGHLSFYCTKGEKFASCLH